MSDAGAECPSGADYNINVDGTTLAQLTDARMMFFGPTSYELPTVSTKNILRDDWPRFIVKVVNNKIDSVEEIDGQNQFRGVKEGFDSVMGDDTGRQHMLDALQAHIDANPVDGTEMEEPTSISTKVPDGWRVTKAKGKSFCEQDMKTDMISDQSKYEKLVSSSLGIPKTSAKYKGTGLTFGLSYETKDFIKLNGKEKKKMAMTQAECATYFAEIEDLEGNPPETEPAFEFLVGTASTERDMYKLFDLYGVNFPTQVVFGARYGTTQTISESSFNTYTKSEEKLSLDFGVSAAVPIKEVPGAKVMASRDYSIGYDGTEEETTSVQKYFNERKTFSVGKSIPEGGITKWMETIEGEPMPIKFDLMPLCEHPVFKGEKKGLCEEAIGSYCEDHIKRIHEDVKCEPTKTSECLWDTDCDSPHTHRCMVGKCVERPPCDVVGYSGTGFTGEMKTFGPWYHADSEPVKIIDLTNWQGKMVSMKIGGGCGKIVAMNENRLDDSSNLVRTNYRKNDVLEVSSMDGPNWLQVYPKEYWTDTTSKYLD